MLIIPVTTHPNTTNDSITTDSHTEESNVPNTNVPDTNIADTNTSDANTSTENTKPQNTSTETADSLPTEEYVPFVLDEMKPPTDPNAPKPVSFFYITLPLNMPQCAFNEGIKNLLPCFLKAFAWCAPLIGRLTFNFY
jgi:hypothetical protein